MTQLSVVVLCGGCYNVMQGLTGSYLSKRRIILAGTRALQRVPRPDPALVVRSRRCDHDVPVVSHGIRSGYDAWRAVWHSKIEKKSRGGGEGEDDEDPRRKIQQMSELASVNIVRTISVLLEVISG